MFVYGGGTNIRNFYSDTDNGTTLNDPNSDESFPATGTVYQVACTSENQNIVIAYRNTSNQLVVAEAKWYKPTFGTGRYDDMSSARIITSDCYTLAGVTVSNSTVYTQGEKSDGSWQSYYMPYTSGSNIGVSANMGVSIAGKLAKLVASDSGLLYDILISAADKIEVWEANQSSPSSDFTKVYTSIAGVVSTVHERLQATMFESSWAAILIGDTAVNNDIYFISSSITRTDNYIGNAETAVAVGEEVEILLGLPIISHAEGTYSAGDIFSLGPYKYQAISSRQVVLIVEEITPIA